MTTRYELIIYWSKGDESFVVEVPELPGCMADGRTYAEAVANAEVVNDEWIETARKLGRPIPEPRENSPTRELITADRPRCAAFTRSLRSLLLPLHAKESVLARAV